MDINATIEAETCYRLWRVRRTLLEMTRDRGFIVDENDLSQTLDDFKEKFGDSPSGGRPMRPDLDFEAAHTTDPANVIQVFFAEPVKIGVSVIRDCVSKMNSEGVKLGIIVVQKGVTPSAKKAVTECASTGIILQVFEESELIVNITQHDLVPKHQVQTSEEKKALLSRYKLSETQLPRLKQTDPVARYYGLRRGQVVKITRPSPTAGRYVTYRLVY